MNDITVWQEIASEYGAAVKSELGPLDASFLLMRPADVPEEIRDIVKAHQAAVLSRAIDDAQEQVRVWTRRLAELTAVEAATRREWAQVESYNQIVEVGMHELADDAADSQKRQMRAFFANHLTLVERAGVNVAEVVDVLSESPKMAGSFARAVSRIARTEMTEDARMEAIRQATSDAAIAPSAAEFSRQWLNGHAKILCDRVTLRDGTQIVVFVCRDGDDAATLAKYTARIEAQWGDVEPALVWATRRLNEESLLSERH